MPDTTRFTHLDIDARGVAWLTLDRPEVHNAFDDHLIVELNHHLDQLAAAAERNEVRALVLSSTGKHFSAGADLGWMQRMVEYGFDDNLADSRMLDRMMHALDTLPCPTLCRVQGAAFGGAVGLVACCDIAIASERATFCLSEVRIGLSPAVISPYVQRTIGPRQMRRYALTAETINVGIALELGLIHQVESHDTLDRAVETMLDKLLEASPQAQRATKTLLEHVAGDASMENAREHCCRVISQLRVSDEGQEGMAAFFEKRTPNWPSPNGTSS
ncbi:enoyl-CoA hydratase-related protein [Aidingimonas lacisalsi]|uniref:enoyl-CoA hydratase-related protein n=1 Tax=Aidingimonas lacisalsi TaxID=2604086 RepID=UPI0011D276E0|nr:enoyl-CoA hydratase-related protein [Aidingimonas lacisalsi]